MNELVDSLCALMRIGRTYEREEVISAVAAHLGFTRLANDIREPIESTINAGMRRRVLGYEGNMICRAS